MKLEFDFPRLTPRMASAIQELTLAVAEASSSGSPMPTDNGTFAQWQNKQQAVDAGKMVAQKLVEEWSVGWDDETGVAEGEETIDRGSLLAQCTDLSSLYYYLKDGKSVDQLVEVGASPQMAKNIITIGGVLGAWPLSSS